MRKRPTIATVAAKAGVSVTTVSFVMNKRMDMSIPPVTRQKVLAAMAELDYRPNPAARLLATGRSHSILHLVQKIRNSGYIQMIDHAQEVVQQQDYKLLITQANELTDWSTDNAVSSQAFMVAGILASCSEAGLSSFLSHYPVAPPVVGLLYAPRQYSFVDVDRRAGATVAMQHLLKLGRRRIAYVVQGAKPEEKVTPQGLGRDDLRGWGYYDAMTAAGLQPEIIYPDIQTRGAARRAILEYIPRHGCPEALFCTHDELAIGVHRALCELGIRMPDDTALIGFAGLEEMEYLSPSVSTMSIHAEEMCRKAWDLLFRRIQDPSLPLEQIRLMPELVIRESTQKGGTGKKTGGSIRK